MAPSATSVYASAEQLYVGVLTSTGPHVTPDLFATHDGDLWCMSATNTLKSKILRRDPRVAAVAPGKGAAVVVTGRATVIDPAQPVATLADPASAVRAVAGAVKFTAANVTELTGAVSAALRGKLGDPVLPPHRVVIAIDPETETVVDFPAGDDRTVVGWLRSDGAPLVFPATWDPGRNQASVPRELFESAGAVAAGRACATFDSWSGYGPLGKQGKMLRGNGRATVDGEVVHLQLRVDRVTEWDGITTNSHDV